MIIGNHWDKWAYIICMSQHPKLNIFKDHAFKANIMLAIKDAQQILISSLKLKYKTVKEILYNYS